jgi:hypothetical protein
VQSKRSYPFQGLDPSHPINLHQLPRALLHLSPITGMLGCLDAAPPLVQSKAMLDADMAVVAWTLTIVAGDGASSKVFIA